MKKISLLIVLFILILNLFSLPKSNLAQQANTAYSQKNFTEALSIYSKMEEQGIQNADLYYNMGNCYYRLQKLGEAILYYKRALRLNSAYAAARQNLQLALTLTRDQQYLAQGGFIGNAIMGIMNILNLNRIAILILFFLLLSAISLHYIWFRHIGEERHLPVFILIILLFFLALSITIGIVKFNEYASHKGAVLVIPSEVGYSGPGTDFTRVFTIHEGMILSIEKEEDNWSQVKLPNGLGGWIPNTSSTRINP